MTHITPAARPVEHVARRVRELRRRRGLTAAQLAERLRQVGLDWDRSIVANLETGRRQAVSVEELLALALVLDVAPVHLLVPTDDEQLFQVTPTRAEPSGVVRDWLRGGPPLAGTDLASYYAEVPEVDWEQVGERAQVLQAARLGTYHGRRLAELLAAEPDLAALLEADRRKAQEALARLRHSPDEEGQGDG
jgi:transcriptional regulator with XRE-family HTH domain